MNAAAAVLAAAAVMNTQRQVSDLRAGDRGSSLSAPHAQSCGVFPKPREAFDMDGVGENGRTMVRIRIWSDAQSVLRYAHVTRTDSIDVRNEGSVWFNSSGLPVRYTSHRVEGSASADDSIELTDSGVVTVRGGQRSVQPNKSEGGILVPDGLSPALVMLLAQCAWHQPNHVLQTWRGDTVRLREAAIARLERGGIIKTVTLFQFSARGINSYYGKVWLDEQGAFFATRFVDGADIVIPAQWREDASKLLVAGARAAEPRMKATATAAGQRASAGVVFTHAGVLDVERGVVTAGMSVFVQGATIREISPDSMFRAPARATIVDAKGATLAPGLWDLDDKIDPADLDFRSNRRLSEGVTSIRFLFADSIFTPIVAQRIASGEQAGPRVFLGCPLDGWYPDTIAGATPTRRNAPGQLRTWTDLRGVLNRCATLGARWVMLNDNLPPALATSVIEAAHRLGLRVTGEQLRGQTAADLIAAGYDQFEHLLQPLSSFVARDADSVAWLLHRRGGITTFWAGGPALSRLDLKSPEVQQVMRTMSQKRIGVTSTLCVYPPQGRTIPHDTIWDRAGFAKLQEFALEFHHAGGQVLVATDGACDFRTELDLLKAAGFTSRELWSMSTIDAARVVGRERDLGSIAPGKLADLLLIDGNPLTDLAALKRIKAVMKDGVLFTNLEALKANKPFLLP